MNCPYKAWIERSEELWRKREEMMTHRHEWYFKTDHSQSKPLSLTLIQGWECSTCDEMLPIGEAERRVNAIQHLSAEDAEDAAEVVWNHRIGTMPDEELGAWVESLRAYASALEGDDA